MEFQEVGNQGDINEGLGIAKDGSVLIHSFIVDWKGQGYSFDRDPIPDAWADYYLQGASAAFPSGTEPERSQAVMFDLPDGHLDYLRHAGVLDENYKKRFTFLKAPRSVRAPQGDLELQFFEMLSKNDRTKKELGEIMGGRFLIPIYTSEISTRVAEILDMKLLSSPESVQKANHKAFMRENAKKYGFEILPGMQAVNLASEKHLREMLAYAVARLLQGVDIWIKYPSGSGGDLVKCLKAADFKDKVPRSSEIRKSLEETLIDLATEVLKSRRPQTGRASWKEMLNILKFGGIVFEEGLNGDFQNINAQATVNEKGEVSLVDFSMQRTSAQGAYLGNMRQPLSDYNPHLVEIVKDNLSKVGNFLHQECGARIFYGVDMLIRDGQAFVIDLNGRFNGSTGQKLRATHLGVPYSLNTNVKLPKIPKDFREIAEILGPENLYLPGKSLGILPAIIRQRTPVIKCDLIGEESGLIEELRRRLMLAGIEL